ncbi:hypothetical protein B0H19DRAFT_1376833 [Mycena capillaripes]|nr:hypothetical protein B0H19DRAFT_1376833 [Mycena capillaripes]
MARQLCTGRLASLPLPPPSMDDEYCAADDFTSYSTFRQPDSGSHSSGMFSGAQNLTVTGQTLTNNTINYTTPAVPSDFRMVPLGDIDLQREISVSGMGVVDRQYERQGVRRLYSARLGGQNTTVAIYQGPGAEEKWRKDIAKYMSVRHPNLVQIRGVANHGGLHATLFHDDLIPFKHFVDLQPSHFSKVYTYTYCCNDFEAANNHFYFTFRRYLSWLSQANHIFSRLQITSNFDDYAVTDYIWFQIVISASEEESPAGFLFLCPTEDFRTGPFSFWWPECPAYWSLDPLGNERLTAEEATELGFPSLRLHTSIGGMSWDASVYAGLRQFHKAKGFDPDRQDVARYLGQPLYQLSSEVDVPFAHVDDEESCAEDDDQDEFSMDLNW